MTAPQKKSGSPAARLVLLVVLLVVAVGAFLYASNRKPSPDDIKHMILAGEFYEPGIGKKEAAVMLGLTEADAELVPKDPNEDSPGDYYVFRVPTSEGPLNVRIRVQGGGTQVTKAELVNDAGELIELTLPEGG